MKPRIPSLASLSTRISAPPRTCHAPVYSRPNTLLRLQYGTKSGVSLQLRSFTIASRLGMEGPKYNGYDNSNARPAVDLDHNVTQEEKDDYAKRLQEDKGKAIRTPWHREGSDLPPVARKRSAGAMTKGKLLTTPSRMLKLILPLTTQDLNSDRKDISPLALLVHPQQPLSYLERLIQAEVPVIKDKNGHERIPAVHFRAEDSMQDELEASKPQDTPVSSASESVGDRGNKDKAKDKAKDKDKDGDKDEQEVTEEDFEKVDEIRINGKTERTGKLSKLNRNSPEQAAELRGGHGKGGVESYSGLGQEAPADKTSSRKFVRWSSSTEIGDFIRDAARGQEFSVEIEGAPHDIRVGVPSFNDRTFYLRMRLRKTATKIRDLAEVKELCDKLAHKGAQRVASGGFLLLCGWWYLVYRLTFETDLGWDVMEPVTYLVGLSTLIGGYVWFLYHNREVSYRSAMNFTISRRQQKLYAQHDFDLRKWETLIDEGNALRKEIKAVANEYDVEWDELHDEKDEKVAEALRKDREKKKDGKKKEKDEDEGPAKGDH